MKQIFFFAGILILFVFSCTYTENEEIYDIVGNRVQVKEAGLPAEDHAYAVQRLRFNFFIRSVKNKNK